MKKIIIWGFASLCALSSMAEEKTVVVTVKNDWNEIQKDEPVVIKLNENSKLAALKLEFKSATVWDGEKEIPSQLDDISMDGVADELAFVADIPAQSTKTFTIKLNTEKIEHNYPPRVYAHMKISDKNKKTPEINYLTIPGTTPNASIYSAIYGHGPCFESEYTAYRIYFDNRQSIDIYGKQHARLELAETNFYTTPEQMKQGYGCDVLWAGKTVSLGSFRGWENEAPSYVEKVVNRSEGILAYGPVRTVVQVEDKDWSYNGRKLNMCQRYYLYAGHRDVEVEITFKEKDIKKETFCTGVMKLETNHKGFLMKTGLAGSWGDNVPDKGKPELIETVGLGVRIAPDCLHETKEDDNNYLMLIGTGNDKQKIRYWLTFCATKEVNGIKEYKDWISYLNKWDQSISHRCKTTTTFYPNLKNK